MYIINVLLKHNYFLIFKLILNESDLHIKLIDVNYQILNSQSCFYYKSSTKFC